MASQTSSDTGDFTLQSPIAPRMGVSLHALSHTGKVRINNEDIYLVAQIGRDFKSLMTNLPAGNVPDKFQDVCYGMVIADGMGGTEGGDVASRLAVSTLVNYALGTPDWIMRTGTSESEKLLERMAERYRNVNAELIEQRASSPDLAGMGTTMTVAANVGAQLFLGHIGDSRAYLFRQSQLRQLTHDHTEAQELADIGLIRPAAIGKHRLRHVLTRVLGRERGGTADTQTLPLEDGDQVLLCTDGLTNMVEDTAIAEVLASDVTVQQACEILVECALTNGGKDNVTVILARYRIPTAE